MELSELRSRIIESFSGDEKDLCKVLHEIEQDHQSGIYQRKP